MKNNSRNILDKGMNNIVSGRSLLSNKFDLISPNSKLTKKLAQSIDISSV